MLNISIEVYNIGWAQILAVYLPLLIVLQEGEIIENVGSFIISAITLGLHTKI